MCWMTAGLLDGSCGGIMYACCQRKDPKALTDYNLIESSRDQSRPLPLDLYTETASDDRKSFLRKACRPYSSTALESMRSTLVSLFFPFFSLVLSPVSCRLFLSLSTISRLYTFACIPSMHSHFFAHRFSTREIAQFPCRMSSIYRLLNPFFLLIT